MVKKFDSYDKMIKYLARCEKLDKATLELKDGEWILNLVSFNRYNG